MAFVFAVLGLFVQFIFLFKREWLFDRKTFNLILIVSAALFLLSYVLMLNNIGKPNLVRILTVPLMASMVFYAVKYIFFKIYKRNPEDTFWSMDISQMRDGIFNFIFWVLSTLLPIVVTYKLLP